MSDAVLYPLVIVALVALIVAISGLLINKSTKKRMDSVKADAESIKTQLSDIKAQVQHVDLEYIKKILIRVTDNEQQTKKLSNDLDLEAEKLKSFMNRTNARFPRKPEAAPAVSKDETDQIDLLEQLKASGHAIPLQGNNNNHPTKFVRSSALRQQNVG